MLRVLQAFLMALVFGQLHAAEPTLPERAKLYAPVLAEAQQHVWPSAYKPWTLAGLVEQETCPSLRHSQCWNPMAELRTSRERGAGLGQFTIAYRPDGSVRFDKLTEVSQTYASLHGWSWKNWSDPHYQLTAIVEMTHSIYGRVYGAATPDDQWAFTLSGYNGGESGVRQDRVLCDHTEGCDPERWFHNVELYSLKTRKANPGYGASAYQINRDYVRNVIDVRRPKYEKFFNSGCIDCVVKK